MDKRTLSLVISDPDALKQCTRCKHSFSVNDFYQRKGTARHTYCKTCRCELERLRRSDPVWKEQQRIKRFTNLNWRANEIFRSLKKRSKRDGFQFDLDVPWIATRLGAPCEISGLKFDLSISQRGPYSPSVDRIISGGGYTKRNCRMVLWCINTALGDWGMEAFLPVAKAIVDKS